MTMKLFNTSSVQDIANAIRARNGLSRTYKIAEMASAISSIATDGTATADKIFSGYTAYGLNGQKMVGTASDSGGTAIVVTDEPDEHGGTIRYINGVSLNEDTVSAGTLFSGVTAHNNLGSSIVGTYVPPTLSTLTVTPTETVQAFPPAGATYAGYSQVTVNGISSNYVGTNVSRMSSSNLTFATGTGVFTAPSGYYSTNATYTLTPKTSENITFNYGNGEFKVSSGYYSSNPTLTLSVKTGTTITPTESEQIAVSSYYFTKGSIKVDGISSNYVGTNVSRMSSSNLTFTTGTGVFTAPKGYYSANATYTLTPKTSANIAFYYGIGLFTVASGYYSSSPTLSLSTKVGTTITPTTESQIAVSSGYFTTGSVYVGAIPSTYVQPTGTLNITSNGTFDVKSYASASVSIAGGEYYSWYKALADRSNFIHLSNFSADTFNAYSKVNAYQFAFANFIGSATFENVKSVGSWGFSSGWRATTTGIDNGVELPSCTSIGDGAFYNAGTLKTISIPMITSIPTSAFQTCTQLRSVTIGSVTFIGSCAFSGCQYLSEHPNLEYCTSISAHAFEQCYLLAYLSVPNLSILASYICSGCSALSWVYAPICEHISAYAFSSCSTLASISFSQCIDIGQYAFNGCLALSYASLPKLSNLSNGGFTNCRALSSIDLPACSVINTYAFDGCINMSVVILRNVNTFGNYVFRSCYNLLSLYLLGSTMASYGANMFSSTPISNYTTSTGGVYGSIYVPASLYNTYITNTSWKPYSARFVSLTNAQIALI